MLMMHKRLLKIQKKFKSSIKKHRKLLIKYGIPSVLVLVAFLAGSIRQQYVYEHTQPDNLVWAVDSSVVVPEKLKTMLKQRSDCVGYRGQDAPKGVGLWAVTQVEKDAFAKLSYGCSWSLSSHAVAAKKGQTWQIIAPETYFSDTTQGVPLCTAVIEHKVPPTIDGFCSNDAGKLTKNPNPEM
jgi:hypothetical protein